MGEEKLYQIIRKSSITGDITPIGFSHGLSNEEAFSNFFKGRRPYGDEREYFAGEVVIPEYKITLTPLEKKVSS